MYSACLTNQIFSPQYIVCLPRADNIYSAVAYDFACGACRGRGGADGALFAEVGAPCVGDAVAVIGVGCAVAVGGADDALADVHGGQVGQGGPYARRHPGDERAGETGAVAVHDAAVGWVDDARPRTHGAHLGFHAPVAARTARRERSDVPISVRHRPYGEDAVGIGGRGEVMPRLVALVACRHAHEHAFACGGLRGAGATHAHAVHQGVGVVPRGVVEPRVAQRDAGDIHPEAVSRLQCRDKVVPLFGALCAVFLRAHEVIVCLRCGAQIVRAAACYQPEAYGAVAAGGAVDAVAVVGEIICAEPPRSIKNLTKRMLSEAAHGVVLESAVYDRHHDVLPAETRLVEGRKVVLRELDIGLTEGVIGGRFGDMRLLSQAARGGVVTRLFNGFYKRTCAYRLRLPVFAADCRPVEPAAGVQHLAPECAQAVRIRGGNGVVERVGRDAPSRALFDGTRREGGGRTAALVGERDEENAQQYV